MAGKINIFNLGSLGVDLVNSPLHVPDGAWRNLQNGEFGASESQGAIVKRGALAKINSSALAGNVRGMLNVPLPLNTAKYLLIAASDEDTPTFYQSTDGATFTDLLAAELPEILQDRGTEAGFSGLPVNDVRCASYLRWFFYPGNDYTMDLSDPDVATAPPVIFYDGATAYEAFRVPDNPTATGGKRAIWITDFFVSGGYIYLAVFDPGGSSPDVKGRVLQFDPSTGTLKEIGNRFGNGSGENTAGAPWCLASYQGRLWAGTYGISGNNQGKVYSIQPDLPDQTWQLELTATLHNGYFLGLIPFRGELYALTDADSSGTAIIQKRTAAGVWSTSFTAPTAGQSWFHGAIVYNDALYVAWLGNAAADCLIKKFDGSSWTTALNVTTTYEVKRPGIPIIFNDELYWPMHQTGAANDDFVLKMTSGGTWSQVLTLKNLRGSSGQFTPDAS